MHTVQKYLKSKICIMIIVYILLALFALAILHKYGHRREALEMESKANLFTISNALERYANDTNGTYPVSINSLITENYLNEFPLNCFTSRKWRPMVNINFFDTHSEGDFSYLPESTNGEVYRYYLLVYGSEKYYKKGGRDGRFDVNRDGVIDNVICVISSTHTKDLDLASLFEYFEKLKTVKETE